MSKIKSDDDSPNLKTQNSNNFSIFQKRYVSFQKNFSYGYLRQICFCNEDLFSKKTLRVLAANRNYKLNLTLIRPGFLRVVFPGGRVNLTPHPFVFKEELIKCQYNFIQLLNNLYKVCWKWKNADIICYKLTSIVFL